MNLPNKLTLLRMILVPVFCIFLCMEDWAGQLIATLILKMTGEAGASGMQAAIAIGSIICIVAAIAGECEEVSEETDADEETCDEEACEEADDEESDCECNEEECDCEESEEASEDADSEA